MFLTIDKRVFPRSKERSVRIWEKELLSVQFWLIYADCNWNLKDWKTMEIESVGISRIVNPIDGFDLTQNSNRLPSLNRSKAKWSVTKSWRRNEIRVLINNTFIFLCFS